jgi:hypothetical protein
MKRIGKIAGWVTINGGMFYLAYLGVNGHSGLLNTFKFFVWTTFFITYFVAFVMFCSSAIGKPMDFSKDRSLPGWISHVYDVALAAFLAYHGLFLYAGLTIAQTMGEAFVYSKPPVKPDPIDEELKEILKNVNTK